MSRLTVLERFSCVTNEGEVFPTSTCDSWIIPEKGTEIWCTGWPCAQVIKPYGDGLRVYVGSTVYYCEELVHLTEDWDFEGKKWGIVGVTMIREQRMNGRWERVSV